MEAAQGRKRRKPHKKEMNAESCCKTRRWFLVFCSSSGFYFWDNGREVFFSGNENILL